MIRVARLSDTLDRATDGRIKLKVYEPGKILPPLEISPSISKGDLPAAYNYMAYDQGRIPAAVLFAAVPFGMEPWEYAAWWFEGEGSKLANEIYNKQNIIKFCYVVRLGLKLLVGIEIQLQV